MVRPLRSLLESIGAAFAAAPHTVASSVECLGVLTAVPSSLSQLGAETGQTVWVTGQGWIEFRQAEFESWLVDVPAGDHLLIIERESTEIDSSEPPSGIVLVVWDRASLATLIGRAVIEGKLSLQTDDPSLAECDEQPQSEQTPTSIDGGEEAATSFEHVSKAAEEILVSSSVDPTDVLERAGLSGAALHPALIEARFWLVSGCLVGPNGQREDNQWLILDDDHADILEVVDDLPLLDSIPALERLALRGTRSESELRLRLPHLCDQRRHQQIEPTGSAKGSLLRWWRLDIDSLEIGQRTALLPCWSVRTPLDGIQIIHGISGEVVRP